jgi:hypothetical protein
VKDSAGQKLGYFYLEEEPGPRSAPSCGQADRSQRGEAASAVAGLSAAIINPISRPALRPGCVLNYFTTL